MEEWEHSRDSDHAVICCSGGDLHIFLAMSCDWFPTAQGLEALPQKNRTRDGAFRGSRHHQCHISCANIYPIQIIQIIKIIPFLMKNPVFIASFLLLVLTYGISKFASLNLRWIPLKIEHICRFFFIPKYLWRKSIPRKGWEDWNITPLYRRVDFHSLLSIVFPLKNPLNCQLVVSTHINCWLSPII